MSRSRSNCSVTFVDPDELFEVIWETPAIRPNCRSSGVATEEAIVAGSAPGRLADTEIVGNSTCGRGATGRRVYARAPAIKIAALSSDVATGRRMKGSEKLNCRSSFRGLRRRDRIPDLHALPNARREVVEPDVDNGSGVEREDLADQQAADDRHAERMPQFGAGATSQRQGQTAEERGERRHHDGPEAQQARLIDRLLGLLSLLPLRLQREVDHHDRVLLHDSDQKNDSEQG